MRGFTVLINEAANYVTVWENSYFINKSLWIFIAVVLKIFICIYLFYLVSTD